MENMRQQISKDLVLLGRPRKGYRESPSIASTTTGSAGPSVISISSGSSVAEPVRPQPSKIHRRGNVILSSDEEDEQGPQQGADEDEDSASESEVEVLLASKPSAPAPTQFYSPLHARTTDPTPRSTASYILPPKSPWSKKPTAIDAPIPVEPIVPRYVMPTLERSYQPQEPEDSIFTPPAEAEKALRDLIAGDFADLDEIEIDMSQAIVPGFKEGITLLPHQVLGREWMRDREDVSKKHHGGILADDMGLGKTVQTLARIVEGRAKMSDKEAGWAAATLVVCPLALVQQWADEVERMTSLRVLKHQGTSRTADPTILRKHHVVVTTYDTIKSEYEAHTAADTPESSEKEKGNSKGKTKKRKAPKKAAIFEVQWFRVILDEAHTIKNVKTKGAVACCALEAKLRWCLTGTPMQNSVTELYSLFKFLRVKPFNDWDRFNVSIAKPVTSGRGAGAAMKRLQVVLRKIMLRRTKTQTLNGEALVKLPKRIIEVVPCEFDGSERAFYTSLETKMEAVLEKLVQSENRNYFSVLLLLLRLRQACNHPSLASADYKQDADAVESKAPTKGSEDADDLAAAFTQLGVTRKCQLCTTDLDSTNSGSGTWSTHCLSCIPLAAQARQADNDRPSSAKIRMVLKLLRMIDERSGGEEKTIIFSQFTSMLNLLEPFLRDNGIKFVRYDGSMKPVDRDASLTKIRESLSTRVILISFKAGNVGLNLTSCSNVILVDMWWNPALEEQAFDRAHRFGQKRDVYIYKLMIEQTVEDRILLLQEKKRALAAAALSGDRIKNMQLGMDDLLALFRHGVHDEDDDEDA